MGKRHQDDLKRIIGIKDTKGGLEDAEFRAPLKGSRNTAYIGGSGSIETSQSSKGGGTYSNYSNPQSSYNGSSNGTTTGGGSSVSGSGLDYSGFEGLDGYEAFSNSGPLTGWDINTPYSGVDQYEAAYDIEDLIDGNSGPGYGENERLTSMYGTDPDTGNQINIGFGSKGYPTPEGWNSWEDSGAGPDETFTAGYYYTSSFGVCGKSQSATDQQACIVAIYTASPTYDEAKFLEYVPPLTIGDTTTGFNISSMKFELTLAGSGSKIIVGQGLNRFACGGGDPNGPGDYCSPDAPLTGPNLTSWPVDNAINFLAGQPFVPSTWEASEDTAGFSQWGTPVLKLNFGDGGSRTAEVAQAADGSAILYETVAGTPVGNFKKYDTQGKLIDVGSVSEIPAHLPTGD